MLFTKMSIEASDNDNSTMPRRKCGSFRLVAIVVAAGAMGTGLWGGLMRIGVALPADATSLAELHGALMICGFLGTLISLERAVALRRGWAYAAPTLSSIGALALWANLPGVGAAAFVLASGAFLIASVNVALRQCALFTLILMVGAVCWVVGNVQWMQGYLMSVVVGWWLSFLILTIAAERLELSRIARPSLRSQVVFAISVSLVLIGAIGGELERRWGPFMAAGFLACAAWLLHHDIARRTVRLYGVPRFSAVAILAGHTWLGIAGILLILMWLGQTAFSYDAVVHAITIGFVLSMVFGHAPIILPAVVGINLRYTNFAYLPLSLLHASVALRIGSDWLEQVDLRALSGVVTVLALIVYAATLAYASRLAARPRRPRTGMASGV